MFIHQLKYTLKCLFKNKSLIFWTYAFPLIMATLFFFAFSNIEKEEMLSVFPIAIVENDEFKQDTVMKEVFKTLGNDQSKDQLFSITYTDLQGAKDLLDKESIKGYVELVNEQPKIVVKKNGIEETVLQTVLQEAMRTKVMVQELAQKSIVEEMTKGNTNISYEEIYQNAVQAVQQSSANITDKSSGNLSYTMIEYYSLIAMTCLYAGTIGMYAVNNTLANMSKKGMRVEVSPTKKWKIITSSAVASYIVQFIGLALLFVYTILVLKVDYGAQLIPVLLVSLVGSLAGLCLGIAVACIIRTNENTKISIIISLTMLGCFFSGMMGITMKYIVDKNIPIINQLNPANMITDALYANYYYTSPDRYLGNLTSLGIFALLMLICSLVALRRQKYDSI